MVVVTCVFPPEPLAGARTTSDVARALSGRGHDVTVLAPFPNRHGGKLYPGYRRTLFHREASADGYLVVRCGSLFSRRSSLFSRFGENVSFGITSALALLFRRKKPGVIYANTWPIFAASMLAAVARLRRIPVVMSLQDIYPESLMSQRRRGSGVVNGLILAIDRRVARGAKAVVAISQRFAEHYGSTRGIEPSRIYVVPNWQPAQATEEAPGAVEACRGRNAIPRAAFLLAYGGNVGVSTGVETLIEAFRHLRDKPAVHLLVAGVGASLDNCRRLAAEIAPERIHFENPWTDTMGVLHAAEVLVLTTRGAQSVASVPSKLIHYLLSGRPVLALALPHSDTAAMVLGSGAGTVVEPDDPKLLADAIRTMTRLSREERQRMGSAGRAWALANVTTEVCLPHLVRIVEAAGVQ